MGAEDTRCPSWTPKNPGSASPRPYSATGAIVGTIKTSMPPGTSGTERLASGPVRLHLREALAERKPREIHQRILIEPPSEWCMLRTNQGDAAGTARRVPLRSLTFEWIWDGPS